MTADQMSITLPRNEIEAALKARFPNARNPMVGRFGVGPIDKVCRDCRYLESHHGGRHDYYKCRLRGVSSSMATDHRLKWPTCGKYEEIIDE